VTSLEYLAAAVKREAAWHILGPVPGDILDEEETAIRWSRSPEGTPKTVTISREADSR
jgi:hypothetical protein